MAATSLDTLLRTAFSDFERGRIVDAELACRRILESHPTYAEAHYLLGHVLLAQGDSSAASDEMETAIRFGLKDPAAYYHCANLLLARGDRVAAESHWRRALGLKPDFTDARLHLANLYFERGDFHLAEPEYLCAIKVDPSAHAARYNLAHALYQQQRVSEAIETLNDLLSRAPGYPHAQSDLANLLEQNNRLDDAQVAIEVALAQQPADVRALIVQARLLRRAGDTEQALKILERALPQVTDGFPAISAWNERGKLLEQRSAHQQAFEAFTRSREFLKKLRPPSGETQRLYDRLHRMTRFFDAPDKLNVLDALVTPATPRPLFLIGINRSGTSLLEQMLASHPAFAAGGEMELIPNALRSLECRAPFPSNVPALREAPETLLALRNDYLSQSRALASAQGAHRWVTDKLPHNLFNLPLIRMLFPEAMIVHIVRHPLDTVISNFSQIYLHRNEWSYGIRSIVELHLRAFDFVEQISPFLENRYLRVRYESLVNEPEIVLRQLMHFLDEQMDDEMLNFHRNTRVARTASYAQVNQPLYTTAIGKAAAYLPYLDPADIAMLLPLVQRLGYALPVSNS